MNPRSVFLLAILSLAGGAACGAGFGLYEMDAGSTAMGGHVTGRPRNASAVYYNPGAMGQTTGTCANVGMTMLHPPLDARVNARGVSYSGRMDPGWFLFPTVFLTQSLPHDFAVGLGFYADFGLGSRYDDWWPLKYDSTETTFMGLTLNPAISYKITDDLSVGVGLRVTYVSFDTWQIRDFSPVNALYGTRFGQDRLNLYADNRKNPGLGFNAGLQYRIIDDLYAGVMYRSPIHTKLRGTAEWTGPDVGGRHENDAGSDIWLPGQCNVGLNWERAFGVEGLHVGASGAWIQWSVMDSFAFDVYNPVTSALKHQEITEENEIKLDWHDTMRVGFGLGYDITRHVEGLVGYVYDWDPSRNDIGYAHTMLPPGDRHVISIGVAWHTVDRRWEVALAYANIIMQRRESQYRAEYASSGDSRLYTYESCHSYTHCLTLGVTYRF